MAKKYQTLQNGREKLVEATVVSTGAAQAGDIVALDSTGRLDVSVLPIGVGPDVAIIETTEALSAGKYVNIYLDSGNARCRLADSTNDRPAHGFVNSSYSIGQLATIFFEGPNDNLSGLTIGSRYYLSSSGGVSNTPPSLPTDVIHQYLGIATSTTTINTDIEDAVLL